MYARALATLGPSPTPSDRESLIEILSIKGAAHARLHQFPEAEVELRQASQICQISLEVACGNVIGPQAGRYLIRVTRPINGFVEVLFSK